MAATVKIKSGETCQWGVPAAHTSTLGVLKSVNRKVNAKTKELPGSDGETIAIVFYDKTTTVTLQIYAKSDSAQPDPGAALTFATAAFLVMDSEQVWASEDYALINVTVKQWVNALA